MAKFQSTDKKSVRGPEESTPHADARYEAIQDGGDPADIRRGDGIWRDNNLDQARAADFGDEDHMAALMGPTRFDAMMHRAYLERMDRRLELTFRCRGSSRTRVYRDPAYRVGPP